jgi:TRAP-type C4-dicarboxylate transport system substrate-binding protein
LTGATVIAQRTWSKIPPALRPTLSRIAREAGERLRESVRRLERDAIAAMRERGVQVVDVTPEDYHEWEQFTKAAYPEIRGKIVPAPYFDEALRLRDEFRATHAVANRPGG